jgi:hypothetical protein
MLVLLMGYMNYAFEMSSDAMTYIPSFHKDWLSQSVVNMGDLRGLLLFFKNKQSRPIQ